MKDVGKRYTVDAFYADAERQRSGEIEFGNFWRDEAGGDWHRVSWIKNTGELYAKNEQASVRDIPEQVEALAVIPKERDVKRLLRNFEEWAFGPEGLGELRKRVADKGYAPSKKQRSS